MSLGPPIGVFAEPSERPSETPDVDPTAVTLQFPRRRRTVEFRDGASLRHYLDEAGEHATAASLRAYDEQNLGAGPLRGRYVPAGPTVITFVPAGVSPILMRFQRVAPPVAPSAGEDVVVVARYPVRAPATCMND